MRSVLRLLGTRYGVATALIVMLILVVVGFRGTVGSRKPTPAAPALEPSRTISVEPSGFDGVVEEPTGEAVDERSAGPSAPALSEAATVASQFAEAWVRHEAVTGDQWRAGISPLMTASLATLLAETDPANVPAEAVTGKPTMVERDPLLAEATVPLNRGVLLLTLVVIDRSWKVDGVGWERPT